MKISNQERNKMSTNREELIAGIKQELVEFGHNKVLETLLLESIDLLEADAREIESIECDYTDQVLRAIEAEEKLAQQVAGFQCEPQTTETEDGFCEWVCPVPIGYLMQCCDCGLIHEVETRVVKYDPRPSENFITMDDPDLQVQLRMKRRDDLAPKGEKP